MASVPSTVRRRSAGSDTPLTTVLDELFVGDLGDGADAVVARALSGEGGFACLGNAHVLATARKNPDLLNALAEAWMVFPDGFPVAWMQRRLGQAGAARIAGPDLMPCVVERGQAVGLRHFLWGSTDDVLERLEAELRSQCPQAEIVGRYAAPGFGEAVAGVDGEALELVQSSRPQIVWCALGAPKQELWMQRNAAALAPAVLVGVGAAFDFIAGTKPRAPLWLQRVGLEWLHRMVSEPRRLGPRYMRTNGAFLLLAARELGQPRPR